MARPRHLNDVGNPPDRNIALIAVRESLRGGLWFIPVLTVVAVSVLSAVLVRVDRHYPDLPSVFQGDATSAQDLLSTIASSTLTMTTLVLSITIVALQLASQQFSPRVMRTFFRDRGTKVSLGIFIATTVYALLVLREIVPESADQGEFVPPISVSVAFGLVLSSLGALIYYLNHVAHSIRAVHIINAVAEETRTAIRAQPYSDEHLALDEWPARPPDHRIASEQPPGVLVGLDEYDVVALAERRQVRIRVVPHVGDFLPSGAPLADVWTDVEGAPCSLTPAELAHLVGLGRERTMRQDVAFGFRQLVDMAEKALSPAVNDPTTAVQALDVIHDLLRRLAISPDMSGTFRDRSGTVRLDVPVHQWEDYVHLAFDEIRQYGGGAFQIQQRMRATIDDLLVALEQRPERRAALTLQLDLLDRAADRAFAEPEDRCQAGSGRAAEP